MQEEKSSEQLARQCLAAALDWYQAVTSSSPQALVMRSTLRLLEELRPLYEERL